MIAPGFPGYSLSIACCDLQACLDLVHESCALFQDEASANCLWTGILLKYKGYDTRKAIAMSSLVEIALLHRSWDLWVNFVFMHSPSIYATRRKNSRGRCPSSGLPLPPLVHNLLSGWEVFYLECDTAHFPVCRILLAKWEPALAVAEYLLATLVHQDFSHLSLAVSMSILQSLEATPAWIGPPYLRAQYDVSVFLT